ncbi:CarD family transcriptional regulator [Planococcus sp. 107-1]|uniref:CarD family transcriptional regulator n=1 Tax=Planococcus sp. 107-1 TaxID=2908840 RepID=UPI001F43B80D|nr:CarD family transcriptional regulator [Planococcus sp. 107-1]UJF27479.1 CarD family transcriptional regulator [Planococcus sp. 107-1]
MFNIGDQIIYSAHGICRIDDICEETVSGVTKTYYKLHPLENSQRVTISTPIDNDKVLMLDLLDKEEATELLETFSEPGIEWNDNANARQNLFSSIIAAGDRKEIAKVVNTLMRKKMEVQLEGRNLYERDHKVLNFTQSILFKELALSLDTNFEDINNQALHFIREKALH